MTRPIVVGTDGSPQALRAVEWAAAEAARREAPLRVVTALLQWAYDTPLRPPPLSHRPDPETQARTVAEAAAARVAELAPGVATTAEVAEGEPAKVLRDAAGRADLVVTGSRGHGGFTGLLIGSTVLKLADRLPCPLVVVRETHPVVEREVVAGIDSPAAAEPVLEFAFAEAALLGARLRAVHAWTHPVSRAPGDMVPLVYDVDGVGQEEARLLAETVAGWRGKYPDVELVEETVHGAPARTLVGASARAGLLVVGARRPHRHGGFGSVAHAVLHHAHCPVAVVRPRPDGPGTAG